ncbi:NAD(P)H nitroreductase [Paraglaciecola aquimarina]|uniref:Putative NAD(P)H nitroreductase n=1 Tax=Paraglaciecola aquimarina TaxID=1235557 RepID=A0ABU3SXC0_9ALTE|nr:NAD(P)H nitroreductase [Paraglaciecola aquimarina]MDU0354659.1 NAD(P)H nitroreductase [Paraglaciecola aquimarina]
MQALDLLLNRSSQPRLQNPAPEGQALENIMQAALRAPDHAALTPWKFIVCQGNGLTRLGEIYQQAAIKAGKPEKDIERAPQLPVRAPMVIVAISKYQDHEKVPWVEQVASTSCAVNNMQMAALAQGFGGVWRTGWYAQDEQVKHALNLSEKDEIVGFLYLGTTCTEVMPKPAKNSADYFEFWQ